MSAPRPSDSLVLTQAVQINMPEAFDRMDFLTWLSKGHRILSVWRYSGKLDNAYSDAFLFLDANDTGSNVSGMPADLWIDIVRRAEIALGVAYLDHELPLFIQLTNRRG